MNSSPTGPETITKISQGIRSDINLWRALHVEKGVIQFDDTAKESIRQEIGLIFQKLEQIRANNTLPEIKTALVGNVSVIMSSPKKKPMERIGDLLASLRKWKKKEEAKDSPKSIAPNISPDIFGSIYLHYIDENEQKAIIPIPITVRLSDKWLKWDTYWEFLTHALAKKFQFDQIIHARERKDLK